MEKAEHRDTSSMWHYILVIVVSCVVMFWRLELPDLNGHEAYVAVTAKAMANPSYWLNPEVSADPLPPNTTFNHWMVPVFNGEPRLVKTPLAYWCLAGLLKLGLPLNEFTARLPSALAGVLLSVLVLLLGRRMFSHRAALIGTLMLATSLGFYNRGRSARPDMLMILFMTSAMVCFYIAVQSKGWRRHLLLMLAWIAVGLGNLAKEFVPLFLGLPIFTYLCWLSSDKTRPELSRRLLGKYMIYSTIGLVIFIVILVIPPLHWWKVVNLSDMIGRSITLAIALGIPLLGYFIRTRGWVEMKMLLPTALPGGVVMLLLFVPWMWYMVKLFPQASKIISHQTVERAVGTGGWLKRSAAPLTGYYIRALAKWTLPWIIFLPGAVIIPFMNRFREDRKALIFSLLWIFGLVLLFSSAVGKHEEYILPALPATCLLMGYCAEELFFRHRWLSNRLAEIIVNGHAFVGMVCLAGLLIAIAFVPAGWKARIFHLIAICTIVSITLWMGVIAFRKAKPVAVLTSFVIAAMLGFSTFSTRAELWMRRPWLAEFARKVAGIIPPTDPVAMWSKVDPAIVYYFGRDIPRAPLIRQRLIHIHGEEKGLVLWKNWLRETPRLWLIGQRTDADELAKIGYKALRDDLPVAPAWEKHAPVLYRRENSSPILH